VWVAISVVVAVVVAAVCAWALCRGAALANEGGNMDAADVKVRTGHPGYDGVDELAQRLGVEAVAGANDEAADIRIQGRSGEWYSLIVLLHSCLDKLERTVRDGGR
jgi:hypothetical protein